MVLEGLLTILQSLVGWLLMVIWQMTLRIVDILERFFNVLAGTDPVYYKGEETYLFNLFFSNRAITNLFWAMAIIAIVISFGFCIVAVARKVTDISGTSKHTIGQIMSNFIRSLVVILLLNICIVAAINVTTVIFDRINFSLENAEELHREQERTYTDEEFATMARILSTMANYASNPSAESRYNVNACFNAIRGEMLTLFETKCFDYDFPVVQTGKHTWQSALAQVAKSANLKEDLQLDTYYPSVQEAVILCFKELKTNYHFKPQETAVLSGNSTGTISTAKLIFLVSTMGAEENEQFLNGNYEDALRRSYINGESDYLSYTDADKDFAITKINYLMGLLVSIACIMFLGKIVLLFVTRMLNIMLLYVVSPLFASSMTLDEGSRFQNWTQSFVMQLLASYASVIMMRIYLLMVPMVVNNELHFLAPETSPFVYFDNYGQLLFVLAGAWAVSKANSLIAGALTGNASSVLQESDSAFGQMISGAIGPSALMRELQRARQNRDRAKSSQKGHEKAEETKQQQKQQNQKSIEASRDRGRNNAVSDKQRSRDDSSISNSSDASLDKMREQYNIDKDTGNSIQQPKEAENLENSRVSTSLSRMREEMGLDNPNAQDSFNIDSLPDLGRAGVNTTRVSTNTIRNRTSNTRNSANMKASLKAKASERYNQQ